MENTLGLDLKSLSEFGTLFVVFLLFVVYIIKTILASRKATKTEIQQKKLEIAAESSRESRRIKIEKEHRTVVNRLSKEHNDTLKVIKVGLEKQAHINYKIMDYLKNIENKYSSNLSEEQYRVVIDRLLKTAMFLIINFSNEIIEKNNLLGNKDNIQKKINTYINNLFKRDMLELKSFTFNLKSLHETMDSKWVESLVNVIISAIYNNDKNEDKSKQMTNIVTGIFINIKNTFLAQID